MDFRRVSQSSTDKLADLYRASGSGGIVSRLFGNPSLVAGIIVDLGETREAGLLPDLLPHCLSGQRDVRESAARAVTKLLAAIPARRLFEADVWIREALCHWGRWENDWSKMKPADVARFADADFGPLAFASMHTNGRVREAALRRLAARTDGAELPFLLLRLNDWVVPIRDIARDLVKARVREEYALFFVRDLALLLRIERCQRGEHRWLSEAMTELFQREGSAEALQAGLHSADRNVRRACLRFASTAAAPRAIAALKAALADADPMCRLWAAKQLIAGATHDELPSLHAALCGDAFMPVRRESLTALAERNPAAAHAALVDALLDKHTSMRAVARFYLKGRVDAAEFYRRAMDAQRGARLSAALLGLSECGEKADAHKIAPFLVSPEIRFRKAAVIAIGRLAADENRSDLLRALADTSPGVSAAACAALRPVVSAVMGELAALLQTHPTPFVRKNALTLVRSLSKWERLPLLLAACRDAHEDVSQPAALALDFWFYSYNGSFVTPSATQLGAAKMELHSSAGCVAPNIADELASLIASWEKANAPK